jgi:hypothetical protein
MGIVSADMSHRSKMVFLGAILLCLAGCQTKLETGYEPAKLGTLTPAERRGLYAQDFTLEARAAQADQTNNKDDYHTRLPGGQP